jgi:sensor c-di-GMP phosphodiesterase-like protein
MIETTRTPQTTDTKTTTKADLRIKYANTIESAKEWYQRNCRLLRAIADVTMATLVLIVALAWVVSFILMLLSGKKATIFGLILAGLTAVIVVIDAIWVVRHAQTLAGELKGAIAERE